MALLTSPQPNPKPPQFPPLRRLRASPAALNLRRRRNAEPNTLFCMGITKNRNGTAWSFARSAMADVVVKRPRRVIFSGRKWNFTDLLTGGTVLGFHFLGLLAPFQFSYGAFWVFVSLYVVTGLFGITLSYHRNLSHRSFKLPKALEYLFAYCGVFALQGSPIDWVSVHRYHHKFTDLEKDPHSPIEGFWYSHISWVFDTSSVMERCGGTSNAGDLEKQSFYRFIQRTYILHTIVLGVLLYALGGVPFIVWGLCGGTRIVGFLHNHMSWLLDTNPVMERDFATFIICVPMTLMALVTSPDVRPIRVIFSGREWSALDLVAGRVVLGFHLLALLAPFQFSYGAFWVFVSLYVATGLFGITLSYHRNLSHRSFNLPKALEYLFAYCGVLAFQGSPIDWVSVHRYHHKFTDSEKDPHSPIEGFWYSHMGWVFDTKSVMEKCGGTSNVGFWYSHMIWLFHNNSVMERSGGTSNVGDLEKQPFYRFIQRTYILHTIALGFLLYALGGLPFIVWGLGVRTVWVYHITWLVNSACHVWGRQVWNTGDLSRNNWWVALLGFGEGWHNNHHAFEYSARHGLEWWQLDMTWYVIRLLQVLGLASDVKLPSDAHKMRMAIDG